MSTVTSSAGNEVNSCQFQLFCSPLSVVSVKRQRSNGVRGVGPADSTGKS
jgi:hypothetical protein